MAANSSIILSNIDFDTHKNTLKQYLKSQTRFQDYDFEGSGLSNILDVLSHNTHLSALIANFALNESYLVTAQLRPSVVSLAESLGYIPDSKKSAEATVNLTINAVGVPGLAEVAVLQPGELVLRGSKDDIDYTFTNRDSLIANAQGTGVYTFAPFDAPDEPIKVYEGIERNQNFIVGTEEDTVYVVPDANLDIETAIIKVFTDQGSSVVDGGSAFNIYTNLLNATTIDEASRLYVLREAPNGYYELTFGNGNSLGEAPTAGNVVNVNYLRTRGKEANGIRSLVLKQPISINEQQISPDNIAVTMLTTTAGGGDKESIESMRKNAPFQYAAQNRMVTALDYSALILKRFSTFIEDIKSWGGEDDPKPDYGKVFTSIVWKEGLENSTIAGVRKDILALADDFSIVSFDLKFTDPVTTYISTETFFQFNPSLTGINSSTIRNNVERNIAKYFEENTGKFDQVFRRSNMLTEVDATDPSVLSSRSKTIIQRRILPLLNFEFNYEQTFPTAIQVPESTSEMSVYSSLFTHKNQICYLRNKLLDRVRLTEENAPTQFRVGPSRALEVVTQSGRVLIENVGEYFPETGRVKSTGLNVQNVPGGKNFIKLFAVPANQSVVVSELNNIIKFDPEESFTKAIVVETR